MTTRMRKTQRSSRTELLISPDLRVRLAAEANRADQSVSAAAERLLTAALDALDHPPADTQRSTSSKPARKTSARRAEMDRRFP